MNKLWLGIALISLTLSAFAHPINSSLSTNATDSEVEDATEALRVPEERVLPRSYFCTAVDALGHRFTGSSFIPGQARHAALLLCENSRRLPRERGCTIERCAPAGADGGEGPRSP